MIRRQFIRGRVQVFVGLILLSGLLFQGQRAGQKAGEEASPAAAPEPVKADPTAAFASLSRDMHDTASENEALAKRDPLKFLKSALDNYDRSVRDYTCTFTKQELLGGELTSEQVMNAMFREKPYSVRLEWTKNADKCARVLYVADRWVTEGQQMAVVEPGAIARLFVPYVMRAIHGADAEKSSRRTIDQFGLRSSLALTVKYCQMAKEKDVLKLAYKGTSKVDDRDTMVFERRLPYEAEGGLWPDRVLVVHLDKQYLLPTLCIAYADDAKKVLLGKYMITGVKLNANLPDSVFTKEGMGL